MDLPIVSLMGTSDGKVVSSCSSCDIYVFCLFGVIVNCFVVGFCNGVFVGRGGSGIVIKVIFVVFVSSFDDNVLSKNVFTSVKRFVGIQPSIPV